MRLFKYTSRYPGYTHTSFNAEVGTYSWVTLRLSLHFRYKFSRSFFFAFRSEIECTSGPALNRYNLNRKLR